MASSGEDEARVLSYHDVLLRRADVDILRGDDWLNDQLVAFYFTYLTEELCPGLAGSVALVPAGASFLLVHSDPSEARVIFEALQLHGKALVVFAVNDNEDVQRAAGGAHWSCLAYHRASNTFRHYDSMRPHNRGAARQLAGAAAPLVRTRCRAGGVACGDAATRQQQQAAASAAGALPGFVEVAAAPQQRNGHDCGLYVCAVTQALCELVQQQQQQQQQDDGSGLFEQREAAALEGITSSSITELRRRMLALIEERAAAAAAACRPGPDAAES